MGCAESRNTVQPQGGGGAFSVVALGGGAHAAAAGTASSSRLFRRTAKPRGEQKTKKTHKPNSLLPEPRASTGSAVALESSSSPSVAAIASTRAVAPSPLAKGPTASLLPGDKPSVSRLVLEELSIEFLKAVKSGDLVAMERVGQLAPLVNIRGMWESTPLVYACQYCHPAAAMWLLARGADAHLANEKGVTPLLLASLEGMRDVVDWILAQPTAAAVHVDKQVGVVYNSVADLNVRANPLLAASMNGHVEIVGKLLAHGATVNLAVAAAASGAGAAAKQFALLLAAKYGHAGVVRLLIKHGADFATSDANGNHALLLACEASREECAMELLRLLPATRLKASASGVSADAADVALPQNAYVACWKQANCHGLTALHCAAANGLLPVAQSMLVELQWGRDHEFLNATSVNRRECALLMACRKRQSEVVQLLVACGADFELPDRGGTTALQVLAREKKDELVKLCESRRVSDAAEQSASAALEEQKPQEQTGERAIETAQTRTSGDDEAPRAADSGTPPEEAEGGAGDARDAAPPASLEADTAGEAVVETLETAAASVGEDDAVQLVPRKPSKPKHRKREQPSPPRRPRQKKSVAKDDAAAESPAAAAAATSRDAPCERESAPLAPVRSAVADRDSLGAEDDAASEAHTPGREPESSAALETPTSPDATGIAASEDTSASPSAEANRSDAVAAADDEDAPSPKKERRKKKKHHASKRSKLGAGCSPAPDAADGDGEQLPARRVDEDAEELES